MRRVLAPALGVLMLASCTFLSGVESLEVGGGTSPDASSASEGAAGDGGLFLFRDAAAGDGARPPSGTCGAEGSWIDCVPDSVGTCAVECSRRNLTCTESCCAFDEKGDFAAKVGGLWPAETNTTCTGTSVDAYSRGGILCGDPILPLGALVRCCCR